MSIGIPLYPFPSQSFLLIQQVSPSPFTDITSIGLVQFKPLQVPNPLLHPLPPTVCRTCLTLHYWLHAPLMSSLSFIHLLQWVERLKQEGGIYCCVLLTSSQWKDVWYRSNSFKTRLLSQYMCDINNVLWYIYLKVVQTTLSIFLFEVT